ncbi:MAG: DUF366 family protein [bacterium]|nr:DUF366 family protein [bacterium]
MKFYSYPEPLAYTGEQLRPHFALETFKVSGDSIVCFRGRCDVAGSRLVDLEDRQAGETIEAAEMLHIVVEHFGVSLENIVLRQRLLVALTAELIYEFLARNYSETSLCDVRRSGDDIFVLGRKATVSIASVSPVSGMIHLGVNIDPEGASVAAWGLEQGGVDPDEFASALGEAYVAEIEGVAHAVSKVLPLSPAKS